MSPLKSAADKAMEATAHITSADKSEESVPERPSEGIITPEESGYAIPEPPLPDDVPDELVYTEEELAALGGDQPSEEWMEQLAERREQERLARCEEKKLPANVFTAVVLFLDENGAWGWTSSVDDFADDVFVQRVATDLDVWHGGEAASSQANFMLLLANTVNGTMAQFDARAQAAMEAQQNRAIAQATGMQSTGVPLNRAQRREQARHGG